MQTGTICKLFVQHCISSRFEHNENIKLHDARRWSRRPSTALRRGTLILEKAQRGIGRPWHRESFGGIWLRNEHRLLPAGHTNLDGQVWGGVPPSHPWLQEGYTLTEGLSAVELPQ